MTEENTPQQPPIEDIKAEADNQAAAPDTTSTRIKELEEETAKLKDAYLRAMAETENVRTRAKRDADDTAKYATTKFARDMVNIIENLGRATQSISAEARSDNPVLKQVGEGLDMTMQELLGIFERHGIKRIDPMGEKFDHNYHQAVAQIPSAEAAPGTVLQVLQAGYVLHDRLLRPAMVNVAVALPAASAGA
jgi:molecular chaperone GrpE